MTLPVWVYIAAVWGCPLYSSTPLSKMTAKPRFQNSINPHTLAAILSAMSHLLHRYRCNVYYLINLTPMCFNTLAKFKCAHQKAMLFDVIPAPEWKCLFKFHLLNDAGYWGGGVCVCMYVSLVLELDLSEAFRENFTPD